jgi:3'-phosphoadenosine 5'-phosphosulfate sulfotransferase (PAPS reductase)/FAD synthetase
MREPAHQDIRPDKDGRFHFVPVSGGKDSTCLALALKEREPRQYHYIITPTGDELPEMVAHWDKLAQLLGQQIISIPCPTLNEVIEAEKCIPNFQRRFCTRKIKIRPYQQFLASYQPATVYVGLRADEEGRAGVTHGGDLSFEAGGIQQRFPLREWGWDIETVWAFLGERGVVIPQRTDCAKCFYQRLGEWFQLWRDHPTIYAEAEGQETRWGHTWRSPDRDTWPAALKDLRARFEAGDKPEISLRMMEKRTAMCHMCSL